MKIVVVAIVACLLGGCASSNAPKKAEAPYVGDPHMRLGNFSVSLAVKDIAASKAFYEKLGFQARGGNQAQKWLVMQNGSATIGLFEGHIPKNSLTFNPGWDSSAKPLTDFDDVRDLQKRLKAQGVSFVPFEPGKPTDIDPASTGPAFFVVVDPDGNPILVDQHVPKPAK